MATTIKQLIEKNKSAFKSEYYIESVNLSYVLTLKALKQIIKEESISASSSTKLNDCLKALKKHYAENPLFKSKLKRSVFKSVVRFNAEYKLLNKALKTQYPELKLKNAAKAGMNSIIMLNTTLIRLKSNQFSG